MKLSDAINARKSVRSFKRKKVPIAILKKIIKDATKAPSACNKQPWLFYVVNSTKKRDDISNILRKTLKPLKDDINTESKMLQKITYNFYNDLGGAQNIIFVYRKNNKNDATWVLPTDIQSISCAVENLMLSAVQEGLGTCWIGSLKNPTSEKELKKFLNIKKNEELVASILVGYPSDDFKPLKRTKKQLSDVLKFI